MVFKYPKTANIKTIPFEETKGPERSLFFLSGLYFTEFFPSLSSDSSNISCLLLVQDAVSPHGASHPALAAQWLTLQNTPGRAFSLSVLFLLPETPPGHADRDTSESDGGGKGHEGATEETHSSATPL